MFTHEFWVNICAHTSSRASAPTQVLLIEWQSHYAKRLAPWDFLINMHTRLVFLLRFFISLLLSLFLKHTRFHSKAVTSLAPSTSLYANELCFTRAHSRTQSADVQHHCYTVSQQKCKLPNMLLFTRLQSHVAGVTSALPGNNNIYNNNYSIKSYNPISARI